MRGNRERLLKLPYSMGCATESCVALGKKNLPKKQKHHTKHVLFPPPHPRKMKEEERQPKAKMRKIRSFFVLPNDGVATRANKVIKRFKSFPKLFVSEEEEEKEREIEIGLPTDVKHVTHIGWDGATAINPTKGLENLQATEILSLSSISLKQFELAMNAQSGHHSVCVSGVEMTQKIIN